MPGGVTDRVECQNDVNESSVINNADSQQLRDVSTVIIKKHSHGGCVQYKLTLVETVVYYSATTFVFQWKDNYYRLIFTVFI